MSRTIDERVVEMQFDNQQFEKNANTTLGTLDKLTQALKLDGAVQGLREVQNSGRQFSLDPISSAVSTVTEKFSALEVIAIGALMRIGSQVVTTGEKILKSLTLDQVITGWNKYAQQTSAVQTLINAVIDKTDKEGNKLYADQQAAMDAVTQQVEKLTWYADETSYSLSGMMSVISTFASQGIDLEEASDAIMGIGNAAAYNGANVQQAQHAMEGFAKAMASGQMSKQLWVTWIKTGGMETEGFKKQLIQAGIAAGTLIQKGSKIVTKAKGTEVSVASFTETLHEGWLNTKAMMSTFDQYGSRMQGLFDEYRRTGKTTSEILRNLGDDMDDISLKAFLAAQEAKTFQDTIDSVKEAVSTKWGQSFEHLFGNYLEAKELWTDMADVLWTIFASGSDIRNEILSIWHDDQFEYWKADIITGLEGISNIIEIIRGGVRQLFAGTDDQELFVEKRVEAFTKITKAFGSAMRRLYRFGDMAFEFAENPDLLVNMRELTGSLDNMVDYRKALDKIGGKDFLESMFEGYDTFDEAIAQLQKIQNIKDIIAGIGHAFGLVTDAVSGFYRGAVKPLLEKLSPLAGKLLEVGAAVGNWITNLRNSIKENDSFYEFFSKLTTKTLSLKDTFKTLNEKTTEFFSGLKEKLSGSSKILEFFLNIWEKIKTAISDLKSRATGLKPFFEGIGEYIANAFTSIYEGITSGFQKGGINGGLGVFITGVFTSLILGVKNFIHKIGQTEGLFSDTLGKLRDAIWDFQWDRLDEIFINLKAYANETNAKALLNIAKAIGILAVSLVAMSFVNPDRIISSTLALSTLMTFVGVFANAMKKMSSDMKGLQLQKFVPIIVSIAAAVLLLSVAVKKIASVDEASMLAATVTIAALMGTLVISAMTLSNSLTDISKGAKVLTKMAVAVDLLAIAVAVFAKMDANHLLQGVSAVALLVTGLTGVAVLLSKYAKDLPKAAKSLVYFAAAVDIMVVAVAALGVLKESIVVQGLLSVYAILIAVAGFIGSVSLMKTSSIIAASASLLVISGALVILAASVAAFGYMKPEALGQGLMGIGVALSIIAITTALMGQAKVIKGAAGILIVSAALIPLAAALKVLGSMKLGEIVSALFAFGSSLAILAVLAVSLSPFIIQMLAISAAVTLFGVSLVAIGAGVTAISVALTTLGLAFETTGSAVIQGMSNIVVGILQGIADAAPLIFQIAVVLINSFCGGITATLPTIANTVFTIIMTILETLTAYIGNIVGAAIKLAVAFIDGLAHGIADNSGPLMDAIANLIDAVVILLMEGIKTAVGWIPLIGKDMSDELDREIETMKGRMDSRSTEAVGQEMVSGVSRGVRYALPDLEDSYLAVATTGTETVSSLNDDYPVIAETQMDSMIDKVVEKTPEVQSTYQTVVDDAILGPFDGIDQQGSDLMYNFINSMTSSVGSNSWMLNEAASTLGNSFLGTLMDTWGIASPSKEAIKLGAFFDQGLVLGLGSMTKQVYDAGSNLAESAMISITKAAEQATQLFMDSADLQPTIRPVLDLTEIQNGVDSANEMLDLSPSTTLGVSPINTMGINSMNGLPIAGNVINVSFNVSTQGSLSENDIRKYGREIADVVNYELGRRVG